MLLPDNIHPQQSVYYNGAYVLKILQSDPVVKIFDLYQKVRQNNKMSFPLFMLCLDWLFLLNVVSMGKNGEVQLCS